MERQTSEAERSMNVQDVMMRAMAKKITWWQAAEILGISARTIDAPISACFPGEFAFSSLPDRKSRQLGAMFSQPGGITEEIVYSHQTSSWRFER